MQEPILRDLHQYVCTLLSTEELALGKLSTINDYRTTRPFAGLGMHRDADPDWRPRPVLRCNRSNADAVSLSDPGRDTFEENTLRARAWPSPRGKLMQIIKRTPENDPGR